ncbi:MAG: hypothetical protein ABEJ27_00770 [Halodesulfurarchaeum sp.]
MEPVLADIEAETNHGLLLVWGNQDYFGDLDESLHVGTEIPPAGHLIVGEHRFTNDPTAVTPGDILITHMEKWSLIDHFDGRAHFCGNTHRGRYKDRRLNAAFLQVTEPETGRQRFGGTSSWRSGTSRVSTWRCGLSATSSGWSVTPTGSGVCSSNPPLAAVCTVGISAS